MESNISRKTLLQILSPGDHHAADLAFVADKGKELRSDERSITLQVIFDKLFDD
jgi:hypothetical protein